MKPPGEWAALREWVVTITANFTAEPIGDFLRFWMARVGIRPARLEFSSYNQVFQELISPNSLLASDEPGANCILIRFEDWARDQRQDLKAQTIKTATGEFVDALSAFAKRSRRPTILLLCPASRGACSDLELSRILKSLESEVRESAAALRGVIVISPDELEALYPVDVVDDPEGDRLGHIPFTRAYWAAMGTMLARKARTLFQPPYKVIVVDADNTLWDGIVGEVGAAYVQVADGRRALQEFLKSQKQRGMLLALASKNREADVAEVFRRGEMLLRREDFVAWKINWDSKSLNISSLASELDLGLDSFIFLDDNPLECADVQANCPGVTALVLPSDARKVPAFLRHVWAFDLATATALDENRTELYRQQSERNHFRDAAPTFREFIEGLKLEVAIAPLSPADYERAAQLTQRTNQFNSSGVRRTASELSTLVEAGERRTLLVRARDRFGDYGEVGLAVYSASDSALHIENLLVSCRVLGKGVEHRLLAALGREACVLGASDVVIRFTPSDRNQPAERFLRSIGSQLCDDGSFRIASAAAEALVFDPEAAIDDRDTSRRTRAASFGLRSRSDFQAIAMELNSIDAILSEVSRHFRRPRPQLTNDLIQPSSSREAKLVKIWEEVLHVYPIGVADSFLSLGGQSLQAASIASRVATEFGVQIPLSFVLSNPTILELNERIGREPQIDGVQSLPRANELSLSPAQQRLWFLDQFIPNRAAYNIPVGLRIQGRLNFDALEGAILRVMGRHDALRSSFTLGNGSTGLKISGTAEFSLRRIAVGSEAEALEFAKEEARRPFDLTADALLRCLVISFGPEDHLLVLNVHHIVSDGWSMSILLRDLADAYAAASTGRAPSWTPLTSSYGDYAAWQRERTASGDFESSLGYWKNELRGAPSLLELPFDKPRPSVMTYSGGSVTARISSAVRRDVESLAERLACTPFMVLLAAWQTLLYRYSQQEDIVVGVPVAGRTHQSLEELVGCFVNTLAIRTPVNGELSFVEHLRLVRNKVLDALAHQDLPFEYLVSEMGLERDLSRSPLFQVMLVLQNTPDAAFVSSGLKATAVPLHNGGAKFDLVLEVTPSSEGYGLMLEYNMSLFQPESAERILRHFSRLVEQACVTPEESLGGLSIMDESETRQMLSFVNGDKASYETLECLHRWFERSVETSPNAPALSCEGRTMSYREVNRRANQIAHHLIECGIGPDILVGICIDRSMDMVIAILAILKAGGAYLPIDLSYPADRLAFILEDAQAPVLLTETKLVASLPKHGARIICLDDAEAILAAQPRTNPVTAVMPDHMAYVIYTSGSTGKPKGCMITHRNVARLMRATEGWFNFDERDVWTLFHSCAFDFSVWEIWGALLYGGRVVVVPFMVSRSPEAFYELLVKEGVTVLNQTPSAFRQLIQAEEALAQRELALRYVIFGGEALEMQSLRPWFDRHGDKRPQLVNMYGITETTVHVTYRPLSKDDVRSGSVIGVPIPDLQVYILDPRLQPVPVGVPGEMFVSGAGLARGYLNRTDLTAHRFIPDVLSGRANSRLYRTGDLARFLPNHDIEYLGRIDHQVKIRGFRIELGEIESVLCEHPAVREAVVLAREDVPGSRRLAAYIVTTATAPEVSMLRDHLRKQLPDYMVPASFVFLDKLPLTSNGKIDRKALPVPEQQRPELTDRYEAPTTASEKELAAIWSKVLRVEKVGVNDNFFELGGDSILSIQTISLARQAGLALTPKLLFQNQTIAELAAVASAVAEVAKAEQGAVEGAAPLAPIEHWFFEQELADPQHYNQSFLFTVKESLDLAALERALAQLEQHHDALRLRYASTRYPAEKSFAPPSAAGLFERVDLSTVLESDLAASIETAAALAQASLDYTKGPLWRALYFDCGWKQPHRMLLVIHHLAVDGVSWRILLEDLERIYEQERGGQKVKLHAKTTSVKEWSVRLSSAYAIDSNSALGLDYWRGATSVPIAALPVELNEGTNSEGSAHTLTLRLEASETESLLQRAPAAYNTQINDLLLAALGPSLSHWVGSDYVALNLEGHGREDMFEGVDLSRTVGWFTSIYPVRIHLPKGDLGAVVKSVKEQLRTIPARGIGFGLLRYLVQDERLRSAPEPGILFNYLGQLDQVVAGSRLFDFAPEQTGPWHSPNQHRRYSIEINCAVVHGRLEVWWTYSRNRYRAETMEKLAAEFIRHLREVIDHCTRPGVRGATPSDFPLAALDQTAVDGLLARIPDLEDVYALAPIQTLFYAAGANDSRTLFDQWHCTLTGPLDTDSFREAWSNVVARHSILRSSFHSSGLKEPVQVVHESIRMPWFMEDWRDLDSEGQVSRWEQLLQQEREQGVALDQAPLHRITLVQLASDRFKFLWSVPALLLDGWSWPLVFRDLSKSYHSLIHKDPAALAIARPYRDYVSWIRREHQNDTEQFWREKLRGMTQSTPLIAEPGDASTSRERVNGQWSFTLDAAATSSLIGFARRLRVTSNSLIQAAWSVVLSRLSGWNDVTFGAAFAGRPTDLPNANNIVGPFVNNLPLRVRVENACSVEEHLKRLHEELLELNPHQFAPLNQIQAWSEVSWRNRLFDSLVVVQNYEVDEAAQRLGDTVAISEFSGPIHTNFPLLVLVEPESTWRITLIYDRRELSSARVERWGNDFIQTLGALPSEGATMLGTLKERLSTPENRLVLKPRFRMQSQNYVPPQNELQHLIAGVWQEIFQSHRISIEDNLFDLGAHSMLVVRLHQRLREALDKDFALVSLFQFPTIRSFAGHLDHGEDQTSIVEVRSRAQQQRLALARMRPASARK
jgi:amino acid adenylation domain-containing protein/FkbH-like protein/non-ribosomal peptide synthase protein (TIGR01720 family)